MARHSHARCEPKEEDRHREAQKDRRKRRCSTLASPTMRRSHSPVAWPVKKTDDLISSPWMTMPAADMSSKKRSRRAFVAVRAATPPREDSLRTKEANETAPTAKPGHPSRTQRLPFKRGGQGNRRQYMPRSTSAFDAEAELAAGQGPTPGKVERGCTVPPSTFPSFNVAFSDEMIESRGTHERALAENSSTVTPKTRGKYRSASPARFYGAYPLGSCGQSSGWREAIGGSLNMTSMIGFLMVVVIVLLSTVVPRAREGATRRSSSQRHRTCKSCWRRRLFGVSARK